MSYQYIYIGGNLGQYNNDFNSDFNVVVIKPSLYNKTKIKSIKEVKIIETRVINGAVVPPFVQIPT